MPLWAAAMAEFEWQFAQVHDPQVDGWHVEQTLPAPPWTIGKLWLALNEAGSQAVVVWQVPQLENDPTCVAGFEWHATQVVGVPWNTPLAWQAWHGAAAWAPVSGKPDLEWSKVASAQPAVVWQAPQSEPNFPW